MEGEPIESGYEGLEVEFRNAGKRMEAWIRLAEYGLVFNDPDCPEEHRWREIRKRFGDGKALRELSPPVVCEMIKMSSEACDGCPANPDRKSRTDRRFS